MTIEEAYRRLEAAWPRQSFCIGVDVWRHKRRDGSVARAVGWSIYDAETNVAHRGPTLENAMEQALGCDADLSAVDATVGAAIRDHQRA